MNKKLYELKGIYWNYYVSKYGTHHVIPYCPLHKMELVYSDYSGFCEKCNKTYRWSPSRDKLADYLRREVNSADFQNAEVISIDGIQIPQLKTKVKIPEDNKEYWIEARLNKSDKGRQIVLYVGEKGIPNKAQIFANVDQEKLSFDHKDRKPEDIFTKITATFPSGKEITIDAPIKNE